MAVSNHGLALTQSFLFQSTGHFRLCLESLSIFEEVCPLEPLSARDSALALVAVSSVYARELSFGSHVQDFGRPSRADLVCGCDQF